jgi:hypothetical protein
MKIIEAYEKIRLLKKEKENHYNEIDKISLEINRLQRIIDSGSQIKKWWVRRR